MSRSGAAKMQSKHRKKSDVALGKAFFFFLQRHEVKSGHGGDNGGSELNATGRTCEQNGGAVVGRLSRAVGAFPLASTFYCICQK